MPFFNNNRSSTFSFNDAVVDSQLFRQVVESINTQSETPEYSESTLKAFEFKKPYGMNDETPVKRDDVHVGDFVFYNGPYDTAFFIVTAPAVSSFYAHTACGSRTRFNTDSERIYIFKSKRYLNKFIGDLKESLEWNDDSGLFHVVEAIKEAYPEKYAELDVQNCSLCGHIAIPKITANGIVMCQNCYHERYTDCNKCGKTIEIKDAYETRSGHYLCKECNKRHWVLPYHYDYPLIEFYGDNKNNSVPFMGFELEVDCGGEDNGNVAKIMPMLNREDSGKIFAYCSHDSSINNGFEIITQPATMQYHYSIMDVYNRAIQKLKAMGYASHETTTCGFHVHFNRTFFGDDERACIRKLIIITEKFWNELCIFARRPERRLTHYAKKMPKTMEISEYMEKANRSGEHEYHYFALNIANSSTIEFRMFRGTLNLNTIMATLQLVNNMVVMAKTKTEAEVRAMRFEDLLTNANQRKYWTRHKAISDFEE